MTSEGALAGGRVSAAMQPATTQADTRSGTRVSTGEPRMPAGGRGATRGAHSQQQKTPLQPPLFNQRRRPASSEPQVTQQQQHPGSTSRQQDPHHPNARRVVGVSGRSVSRGGAAASAPPAFESEAHVIPAEFPRKLYYTRQAVAIFQQDGIKRYSIEHLLDIGRSVDTSKAPSGLEWTWNRRNPGSVLNKLTYKQTPGNNNKSTPSHTPPQSGSVDSLAANLDVGGDSLAFRRDGASEMDGGPEWMMPAQNESSRQAFDMEQFKAEMRRREGVPDFPKANTVPDAKSELVVADSAVTAKHDIDSLVHDSQALQVAEAETRPAGRSRFGGRFFNLDEDSSQQQDATVAQTGTDTVSKSALPPATQSQQSKRDSEELIRLLQQSNPFSDPQSAAARKNSNPNVPTSVLRKLSIPGSSRSSSPAKSSAQVPSPLSAESRADDVLTAKPFTQSSQKQTDAPAKGIATKPEMKPADAPPGGVPFANFMLQQPPPDGMPPMMPPPFFMGGAPNAGNYPGVPPQPQMPNGGMVPPSPPFNFNQPPGNPMMPGIFPSMTPHGGVNSSSGAQSEGHPPPLPLNLPPPHMLPPVFLAHLLATGMPPPIPSGGPHDPSTGMPHFSPHMMPFLPPFGRPTPPEGYPPPPPFHQSAAGPAANTVPEPADNLSRWFNPATIAAANTGNSTNSSASSSVMQNDSGVHGIKISGRVLTLEEIEQQ